jgi:hypothetical protein
MQQKIVSEREISLFMRMTFSFLLGATRGWVPGRGAERLRVERDGRLAKKTSVRKEKHRAARKVAEARTSVKTETTVA